MFFNRELNASNSNLTRTITNQYKKYVGDSHIAPSGLQKDVFRYLMEGADQSSSQSSIHVEGIVDWNNSPHHMNKKAYKLTLAKDSDGSDQYRSRIGFNLFKLPLGIYSLIVEFFPSEMNDISVTARAQTAYISKQTTKSLTNYAI